MVAAVQQHIDEGISKTVNLPKSATVDDVASSFLAAYDLKLKGITIYRDSSRQLQPKALTQEVHMPETELIDRIYGPIKVSKRIAKLLNSQLVTRLKKVHQNGAAFLTDQRLSTTRFEHSVGTLALTQILGGDESTQIAALLHDISHTAFSHVIDFVFENSNQNYHDLVREKFLSSQEAQETIRECAITWKELDYDQIAMIKGKNLNADRLDYALRDLLAVNRIFQPEYSSIVNNLVVDKDGEIKCKDIGTARLIFNKFLEANEAIYFNHKAEVAGLVMATILRSSLRQGFMVEEDFLQTDDVLIAKILEGPFKNVFNKIGPDMEFYPTDPTTHSPSILRKLRYVNPKIVGMPGHLTEHCQESKNRLDAYLTTTPTRVYYKIPILDQVL